MVDIVSQRKRSKMMAGIRGKNTKPELLIRKGLFKRGYRYRLHYQKLPGKPDIAMPGRKIIILVNGCFWHGHDCHLFKWPASRREFWRAKISGTKTRDPNLCSTYKNLGWRVLVVWECAIRGKTSLETDTLFDEIDLWIRSEKVYGDIQGTLSQNHRYSGP